MFNLGTGFGPLPIIRYLLVAQGTIAIGPFIGSATKERMEKKKIDALVCDVIARCSGE